MSVIGRLTNLVCAAKLQRWNTSVWKTPRCLPQPARRSPSLSALSSRVSAFHHESKHQPPLARLHIAPDDVWCAILAVESRGDVVSARSQCSSFTDAPFLRARLELASVSECEVHLCAVSASFYVAVYNFCACIVFRDTFLSLGVNKKRQQSRMSQRCVQRTKPNFLICPTHSGSTYRHNAQSLGAKFS